MRINNRKAQFNYELGERVEAGIVLIGQEVKSVRDGGVDFGASYVKFRPSGHKGFEAWVVGMTILPYKHANNENYDPIRSRKLLLHQREILSLMSSMKQMGRVLVPTAVYTDKGKIKVEIALARGKKKYEKREVIKERDLEREAD